MSEQLVECLLVNSIRLSIFVFPFLLSQAFHCSFIFFSLPKVPCKGEDPFITPCSSILQAILSCSPLLSCPFFPFCYYYFFFWLWRNHLLIWKTMFNRSALRNVSKWTLFSVCFSFPKSVLIFLFSFTFQSVTKMISEYYFLGILWHRVICFQSFRIQVIVLSLWY